MRILLTNNHLVELYGSETWIMTMVAELAKEHEVGVYTKHKGYVSSLLADYIDDNPQDYDLAIINHNSCVNVDAKYKIFTSHGTVPELEIPPAGMNYYVAVNENVSKKYKIPHIIKNPINTELFKPTSTIRATPDRVMVIGNAKVPVPHIKPTRTDYNTFNLINDADVVIAIGRGALEAMSCGRCVITWDNKIGWGEIGDGYLDDLSKLTGNVAGEYLLRRIDWNVEFSKYQQEHGERNRQYILENHDVRKIVQEYLTIWKTHTKRDI